MEDKQTNEVLTEVTSVDKEEKKTGQSIPIPSPEQLLQNALSTVISSKVAASNLFSKLSSKEKNRVFNAILDIPTEGLPVKLKSNEEKLCYSYGQQNKNSQFLVIQDYINKEIQKLKEKDNKKKEDKLDNNKPKENGE